MMALTLPDMRRRLKTLLPYLPLVGQVIEIRRKRDNRILALQKTKAPASLMDRNHSSLNMVLLKALKTPKRVKGIWLFIMLLLVIPKGIIQLMFN